MDFYTHEFNLYFLITSTIIIIFISSILSLKFDKIKRKRYKIKKINKVNYAKLISTYTTLTLAISLGCQIYNFYFNFVFLNEQFNSNKKIFCILKILILFLTLTYVILFSIFKKMNKNITADFFIIILFMTIFQLIILEALNISLITMFLAFEGLTFSMFILLFFPTFFINDLIENEKNSSILKYFFFSVFLSLMFLCGILMIYIATGTFDIQELLLNTEETSRLRVLGFLFLIGSLVGKIGIFPGSFWVFDVYRSLPTPILSYVSIIPKTTLIFTLAVFIHEIETFVELRHFFVIFSFVTMFQGMLGAVFEDDIRHVLAFASVTQSGMLLLLMIYQINLETMLAYLIAYSLTFLFIFSILNFLEIALVYRKTLSSDVIKELKEGKSSSYFIIFGFMSLTGIPPFSMFFPKLSLLYILIERHAYLSFYSFFNC